MTQGDGKWTREKVLGSGGFGSVILWKNNSSGEQIAIKQCRLPNDAFIGQKHRERWELEVQIMKKLEHPNIVKAFDVPEELRVPATEMPVLAMEYCSKGDLRKVLNLPENCCGLPEQQVRTVLQSVSSAIEHLHSRRIIHRDLKPENIVLKEVDGQIVYKLIDLGYAKELDQGSLCTSFVGTVQYLAPELFLSQEYTCTVDFWSFGLLTHECITGSRPFLPNMTPAQWMPLVCKKKSNHICVYTKDDETCYSETMFKENYLPKVLVKEIERWLQSVLDWDSQKRGYMSIDGKREVVAFRMLKEILERKTVDVFCVRDGSLKTYFVNDDMCLDDLYQQISADVNAPVKDLGFFLPTGFAPKENDVVKNWNSVDGRMLFAFSKARNENGECQCHIEAENVELVSDMIKKKNLEVKYEVQLKMWAHAVYFCKQEFTCCKRFLLSQQTLMRSLMYSSSQLNRIVAGVRGDVKNLEAVFKFFQKSVDNDKLRYEQQLESPSPLSCKKLSQYFKYDDIRRGIMDQIKKTSKLEQDAGSLGTKVVQLQQAQSMNRTSTTTTPIEEIIQKVIELYGLRKKSREARNELQNNHEMVALLFSFRREKKRLLDHCHSQIHKMMDYKSKIETLISRLQTSNTEITELNSKIEEFSATRQDMIWKGINYLTQKLNSVDGKVSLSMNSHSDNFFSSHQLSASANSSSSLRDTSSTSSADMTQSLMGFMNKTSNLEETVRESKEMLSRLHEVTDSLTLPSEENLDWDSLKNFENT